MPPSRALVLPRDYPRGRPIVQGASLATLRRNQLPNEKVSFHVRELIPTTRWMTQPLGKPRGPTQRPKGNSARAPDRGRRAQHTDPYPNISKQFPGKIGTSTPYVIGKIVSRLEMDSRWALARSLRALVAERDALKESSKAVQVGNSFSNACPIGRTLALALTRLRPIRHAPCAAKSTRMRLPTATFANHSHPSA